jgi:PAS domain S-box-containing protein
MLTTSGAVLNNVTRVLNIGGPEHLRNARSQVLRIDGFETIELATADRLVEVSRQLEPSLILLSAEAEADVVPIVSRLKSESNTTILPIVVILSATHSESKEIALLDAGVEFCLRDPSPAVLLSSARAALRTALTQFELRRALKQERLSQHELSAARRSAVESDSLHREMSESFPYGLWMSDPAGSLIFISDSFLALTECTVDQARSGEWRKRIATEDSESYAESWSRSLRTGEPWEHEFQILGPDGEYHHVLSRGRPILSHKGDILAWAGINLDVDERKRQEQHIARLASGEEMRRRQSEAILNSMTQALVMYDLKCGIITMNPAGQALHGFNQSDMPLSADLLKASHVLSNSEGQELVFDEWPLMIAARGRTVSGVEVNVHRRGAGEFWIANCSGAPVLDGSGEVRFAVSVLQDVTEQKLAERALRASEERFRLLSETIPNLVWTATPEGRAVYMSRQWLEYTGQSAEDAAGWGWMTALHPDDREPTVKRWIEAVSSRRPYEATYRLQRNDGEFRWHIARGFALISSTGEPLHWFGTSTDIQEQKDIEEELRKTNALFKRSNEDLQHFAFAISHDLQEPLRMVSGFAEVLARRLGEQLTPDIADYVEYITDNTTRMQQMISDLLMYSRVTHGDGADASQCAESQPALEWAVGNLTKAIEESGAVIVGSALPAVAVDFGRVTQLFQNLLSNSIKYRSDRPVHIEIRAEDCGDKWKFCVADNGIGIGPEYHERIFGVFKRLHGREVPGTGIGLALCRRIVERYGGRIWIDSNPGEGARFYFTLPKAERAAAAAT